MTTVSTGMRGYQVKYLQRLLNKNGARPRLSEDGIFGPRTQAALTAFQNTRTPGVTGPATQQVFQSLGMSVEIEHSTELFGQPTGMTCWSAAMTMARGANMSVGPGRATLGATGGLTTTRENVATYARDNGMRILSEMSSIPVSDLIGFLRRGPVVAIGAGRAANGNRWAHASVISGVYSDQSPDATGTLLRIHDPWPPNRGAIYGVFVTGGMQSTPNGNYDLFGAYLLGR